MHRCMFIYLYLHQTQEDNYFHYQVGCILKSVLCLLGPVSDKEFLSVLCNHVHTYWAHSMSHKGTTPDTAWSRQTSVSLNLTWHGDWTIIPHICHFFYTGRIFEYQYFTPKNYEKHPKITRNSPKKCKICSFSRSICKILLVAIFRWK